jgi:hypothetical protein
MICKSLIVKELPCLYTERLYKKGCISKLKELIDTLYEKEKIFTLDVTRRMVFHSLLLTQ